MTDKAVQSARAALETSTKDDGDESTFIGGRRNSTINGTAYFDRTEDTGQAVLQAAFESATGIIYFLITTDTAGDEEFYGSGVLTSKNISFPDESIMQLDFSIQVSGALNQGAVT